MTELRTQQLSADLYNKIMSLEMPRMLKTQLEKSASSIYLNLLEANETNTFNSKRMSYKFAYISLKECRLLMNRNKLNDESLLDIISLLNEKLTKLNLRMYS